MGIFKDLKKVKKQIDKNQKKVDKLFGNEKTKAKPQPKVQEPKQVEKTYKLVKINKAYIESINIEEECLDVNADIEQTDNGYCMAYNGNIIGYFPASANAFLENHEDDIVDTEFDVDEMTVRIEFEW